MNFKHSIILFIIISIFSGVGLFLTKTYARIEDSLIGKPLFPVQSQYVTSISWHVSTLNGTMPVVVKRTGQRWSFVKPFPGSDCDERTISAILDAASAMRVTAPQGRLEESEFIPTRELILSTTDQRYSASFGNEQPFVNESTIAEQNGELVAIPSNYFAKLPRTINDFRTKSLLAFIRPSQINALEWHVKGSPFTRIQRKSNTSNWELTQPFTLTLSREKVRLLLERLTQSNLIDSYLTPDDYSVKMTPTQFTSTELIQYGLDEEHAIRLSVYVRGLKDPLKLRFGKNDPIRANHVFCLLSNDQAIVSIPKDIADAFTNNENSIVNATDIPVIADVKNPTKILLRQKNEALHTTYTLNQGKWMQQSYECETDVDAMAAFQAALLGLRGDLVNTGVAPTEEPLCVITIEEDDLTKTPIKLTFYRNKTTQKTEVYREDNHYSYALKNESFLLPLLANDVTYALLSKQLLSIPKENIQTITLQRPGLANVVLTHNPSVETEWQTISPAGAFVNPEIITTWLEIFGDLRATKVIGPADDPNAPWGADIVGNVNFSHRMILDLKNDNNSLRKILLFEKPQPGKTSIQVLVHGSPILYEIPLSLFETLQQSPLIYEMK